MNRHGMALVAALLALLIAGAVGSAALATAHFRWRAGVVQLAAARATARVERALEERIENWDPAWADSLPNAVDLPLGGLVGPGFEVGDTLLRLGPALFQVRASAEERSVDGKVLARDGASLVIALGPPAFRDTAAVISPQAVTLLNGAKIIGGDRTPPGWDPFCPPPDSTLLAALIEAAPLLRFTPEISAALRPSSGSTLSGIIAAPSPRLHPDGSCEAGPLNWGDPGMGACGALLPIVVLQGGARVVDGMGAGTLLALGDLELSGSFSFTGVMLAMGRVRLGGQARLVGSVIALGDVELEGMAEISHSGCAVRRAVESWKVVPKRVRGGGWRVG